MSEENNKPVVSTMISDPVINTQLNQQEASMSDGEFSANEIAQMFGEIVKNKKPGEVDLSQEFPFKGMSLQEIEEWEANEIAKEEYDIYKVKARVLNLMRSSGFSITPQGEAMANTIVHHLMSLYAFAETINDKDTKNKLINKIRDSEKLPATIVAASMVGK